jgi:hypothetical protein
VRDHEDAAGLLAFQAPALANALQFTPAETQAYIDATKAFQSLTKAAAAAAQAPPPPPAKVHLSFGADGHPLLPPVANKHYLDAGEKILATLGKPPQKYTFAGNVLTALVNTHKKAGMTPQDAMAKGLDEFEKAADASHLTPDQKQAVDNVSALLQQHVFTHGTLPTTLDVREAVLAKPHALAKFSGPPGTTAGFGTGHAPAPQLPAGIKTPHPEHSEDVPSPHITAEDQKFREFLNKHMLAMHKGLGGGYSGDDDVAKNHVGKALAQRIKDAGIDAQTCKEALAHMSKSGWGTDPHEKFASAAVAQWAVTSADSNATSIGLQILADKMFGADTWKTKPKHIDQSAWKGGHALAGKDSFRKAGEAFLQAMYDHTQQFFNDRGITHIVAFRGVEKMASDEQKEAIAKEYAAKILPDVKHKLKAAKNVYDQAQAAPHNAYYGVNHYKSQYEAAQKDYDAVAAGKIPPSGAYYHATFLASGNAPVKMNPLSSWSLSADTAGGFAGAGSAQEPNLVFAALVPVKQIVGSFVTGFGCRNEHEVVLKAPPGGDPVPLHWVSGSTALATPHLTTYTHS